MEIAEFIDSIRCSTSCDGDYLSGVLFGPDQTSSRKPFIQNRSQYLLGKYNPFMRIVHSSYEEKRSRQKKENNVSMQLLCVTPVRKRVEPVSERPNPRKAANSNQQERVLSNPPSIYHFVFMQKPIAPFTHHIISNEISQAAANFFYSCKKRGTQ